MVGSHEVAGLSYSRKLIWPNDINSGCFLPHVSQNEFRSIPSLTSQSCGDSLLDVCLARQGGAINRPPEHRWTPGRPMNESSVKVKPLNLWQWYKHELLVYFCICRMVVKSQT